MENLTQIIWTIAAAAIPAILGVIGAACKKVYTEYINDKRKKDVTHTVVKAVEQLYRDLGGPEKLKQAQKGIAEMLNEKGIAISELEINMLIEECVEEFNHGFEMSRAIPEQKIDGVDPIKPTTEPAEQHEEHGDEDGGSL